MFQRKGKRSKGLAAAGWHGEGVQPLRTMGTFVQTGLQNGIALLPHRGSSFAGEIPLRLCTDLCQQDGKVRAVSARSFLPIHKGLGVDEVGIYETGVKHPGKKGEIHRIAVGPVRRSALGQGHLLPAIIGVHGLF